MELINIFNEVSKIELPYKIIERRKSDLSVSYADSRKSNKILKWETRKTVKDMCESALIFLKMDKRKLEELYELAKKTAVNAGKFLLSRKKSNPRNLQ